MTINYFESATSKEPRLTTLEALVKSILTSVDLQAKTENYRDALRHSPKEAAKAKRQFGAFLPAALVHDARKRDCVTALTGLVICDFDHVPAERLAEVRRVANADPHTVLSYVTLSGEGLRVLAAIEVPTLKADKKDKEGEFPILAYEHYYQKQFEAVNEHYARLLGLPFDPACKDLSRLSFVAFDPEAYFNPEASAFGKDEMTSTKDKEQKSKRQRKKELNKRLNYIQNVYLFQVKPVLKIDGAEFVPGRHNDYVMRVGYRMNQYGFNLEDVQAWAVKEFSDYPEAASVIASCYNKKDEHGVLADKLTHDGQGGDAGKMPKANRTDILLFMKEKFEWRRNIIKGQTEIRWTKPLYEGISSQHSKDRRSFTTHIDPILHSAQCLMETECGLDAGMDKILSVINNDMVNEFDPFLAYLTGLPEWVEGRDPDYIAEWASSVHIIDDDPQAQDLFYRCLKKWVVAMLAGWTYVNVTNQTILIFIGKQGTFKSTWMQHIMPPALAEYFKTKQNAGDYNKDERLAMSRYGLILHEEMDALTVRENNELKAMTTTKSSDERQPYAITAEKRENIASLCGTGNNEHFLTDDNGTRRMLTFRVEVIKSPIDHPFNYDGIYSQAYALMKDVDFRFYFSPEEQAELEAHNRQFVTASAEEGAVMLYVRKPESYEAARWMPASMVAEELAKRTKNARYDANKIGKILTAMGFEKKKRKGTYGYNLIIRDFDDSERYQKQLALDEAEDSKEDESETMIVSNTDQQPEMVQKAFGNWYDNDDDDDEREIDYSDYKDE